jgi:hypothetical protein
VILRGTNHHESTALSIRAVEKSECMLVAGAGGGFDEYTGGLPIYECLRRYAFPG